MTDLKTFKTGVPSRQGFELDGESNVIAIVWPTPTSCGEFFADLSSRIAGEWSQCERLRVAGAQDFGVAARDLARQGLVHQRTEIEIGEVTAHGVLSAEDHDILVDGEVAHGLARLGVGVDDQADRSGWRACCSGEGCGSGLGRRGDRWQ